MRIAICPGSFDPVTRGPLDVIGRAARLFDRLHVAVIETPAPAALFTAEERVALLREELKGLSTVEVFRFDGLTVAAAAAKGAGWIVRGLRSEGDLAYELPMAHTNRLCGEREVETVFVPASPAVAFISSSLVREIAARRGKLDPLVTPRVAEALRRKLP
ncbi:MAG: pantetheine-phosphate adenylyltransferase [Planctomycetes bacterium]|nr:pantetheine-phosphate adenylyltransferase [Planctomycetota bacterium]